MADIVQSLFGLTPEAYQQQQAAAADRMALEYAKLSPMQQAQFAIGRGAYQLAGALGGALGGQDPELQRISTRNAIAQQIDYTNPQSMMAGVQALSQAGDTVGAMQLADILRKTESEMALRGQRMAAAQASLAQATRERVQQTPAEIAKAREIGRLTTALQTPGLSDLERMDLEAQLASLRPEPKEAKEPTTQELTNARAIALRAGPVGSPEFNAAFDAEYKRLTTKPDAVGAKPEIQKLQEYAATLPVGSIERKQVEDRIRSLGESGGTKVEVKLSQQQEKGINANKVKLAGEVETGALSANDRITLARNMRALLPTAFTGLGSDVKLQASRVAEAFGIPVTGTNESQIIDQILGQMTIGAAGQLKGALSDKDREFLKQTIGTRGLTRATLEFVAQRIERDARVDSELNDAVNAWQSSGKSLNEFNFVRARSEAANKVDAEIKRLEELRRKQRGG